MRLILTAIAAVAVLLLAADFSIAVVFTRDHGDWPQDWPAALEPYRARSRTIDVATVVHQGVYEIPIRTPEEFEAIWLAILSVKSPKAPLTIREVDPDLSESKSFYSYRQPIIHIFAPPNRVGLVGKPGWEKRLSVGPPWPASIISPEGELPEYVQAAEVDGVKTWVAAKLGEGQPGFYYRARVEIELVVDGIIIDPERIDVPADTPIIDKRSTDKKHEAP
jgi:hypothetical protein